MRDPFGWPRGPFPARRGDPSWDFTGNLPAGVTFTRAGSATYFDAAGMLQTALADVPRFDHDPVTKAPKGLLIEGPRTNLLLQSEEFSDAAWVKGNSTIDPNSIAAPTGAMTADTLVASGTSIPSLTQGFSITSGTIYTASCFFKKKDVSRIAILFFGADFNSGGANLSTTFDLDAGSITSQGHTTATITNVGGGWYRCTVTHLATATRTVTVQLCRFSGASTTSGFGTYVWGAQLEAGAFPSSYIPTTTAAATRAADTAVMTGANFSRWFNPNEGTFLVEFYRDLLFAAGDVLSVARSAPGFGPRHQLSVSPTNRIEYAVVGNAGAVVFQKGATYSAAGRQRISAAYGSSDFAVAVNGGPALTGPYNDPPTALDALYIGISEAGTGQINGHIRSIRYWPTRLSNATLQEITA